MRARRNVFRRADPVASGTAPASRCVRLLRIALLIAWPDTKTACSMSTQHDDEAWVGELLDKLDIGAFQIDNVTERVVRINAACARLYGFAKPEDAVGHSALDMYEDPKERHEVTTRFVATEEFPVRNRPPRGRRVRIDTREPLTPKSA